MISVAILPCYKTEKIAARIATECTRYVDYVICVDDGCPYKTWQYIEELKNDRIVSIRLEENVGVGGAVKEGIKAALDMQADIIIKVDSDGQADPRLITIFLKILKEEAHYVKGNRFKNIRSLWCMPRIRLVGNLALGFLTKLSTGYWELFDPTNGYIGFTRQYVEAVEWEKTDDRYFFETDLLFRSAISNIKVIEVGMNAHYGDEISSLNPLKETLNFGIRHIKLFTKRLLYQYLLLNFNIGSMMLIILAMAACINMTVAAQILINIIVLNKLTSGGILTVYAISAVITVNMFIAFMGYDASTQVLYRNLNQFSHRYGSKDHQESGSIHNYEI